MAVVLKLVHSSTELSLNAASGAGLRHMDWIPQVAVPIEGRDPAPVTETFDLWAERDTDDNLAATIQSLDYMRVWADRYMRDPNSEYPVWFHAKMGGETGERRALVRSIGTIWQTAQVEATGPPASHKARLRIVIERETWWEELSATAASNVLTETAGTAITFDYTAGGSPHDVAGDVAARIRRLCVWTDATGAPVSRLWIGLRSADKHGTLANFVPTWECEVAGATLGTDAARAADTTASPGGAGNTKVTVTPGTTGWAKRLTIELQDITANEVDNFGDFLWLLRHKLSASGTWEVRCTFGYTAMDDFDFVAGPIVELSNTSWDYAEVARMQIPLRSLHVWSSADVGGDYEVTYCVQIWARRTSGTSNLDLDCLCLIPIDEGWAKSWDFAIPSDANGFWIYGEGPSSVSQTLAYNASNQIAFIAAFAASGFRLPVGDGRMIILYAAAASHSISTGIQVDSMTYFERWISLRGGE